MNLWDEAGDSLIMSCRNWDGKGIGILIYIYQH